MCLCNSATFKVSLASLGCGQQLYITEVPGLLGLSPPEFIRGLSELAFPSVNSEGPQAAPGLHPDLQELAQGFNAIVEPPTPELPAVVEPLPEPAVAEPPTPELPAVVEPPLPELALAELALAEPAWIEPDEENAFLTTRAEYLDALYNMCPDNMRSNKCRTFQQCQEKGYVFRCPATATCTEDFRHDGYIHTFTACKAKYGEHCARVAEHGRCCLQRVTLCHVATTCRKVQLQGYCENEEECPWGHDYPFVRFQAMRERRDLGEFNYRTKNLPT
jgi:hypothetical protein